MGNETNSGATEQNSAPSPPSTLGYIKTGLSLAWKEVGEIAKTSPGVVAAGSEAVALVKNAFQGVGAATGFLFYLNQNEKEFGSLPVTDYRSHQDWIIGRSVWQTSFSVYYGTVASMETASLGPQFAIASSLAAGKYGGEHGAAAWDKATETVHPALSSLGEVIGQAVDAFRYGDSVDHGGIPPIFLSSRDEINFSKVMNLVCTGAPDVPGQYAIGLSDLINNNVVSASAPPETVNGVPQQLPAGLQLESVSANGTTYVGALSGDTYQLNKDGSSSVISRDGGNSPITVSTTSARDGDGNYTTGSYSIGGSGVNVVPAPDGKLVVSLPNGSATIDPQSGTASATIGGSHYEAVGSGSLSADSAGNTTIGFGSAGSAIVASDGNSLFSLGNSVLTLPPGTRVVPSGDGGFSVVPPAGAAATISGQGGTVVTLEPGQALNVTRDSDGGISAALAGTDKVVNVGAAGELSMEVGGVPVLDAPAGTAGAADAAVLIAAAGIELTDEQKQALEVAATEAVETPDYPTVDTSSYAAWTQSRAAEIGAYQKNDAAALALVSDPSALAIYGSAQAVGAVHAALVNPTTSNVLLALNATIKASVDIGIALDKQFLQNTARQLGIQDDRGATEYGPEDLPKDVPDLKTAGEKLADYISTSGAALNTLAAVAGAIDDPSIRSVAGAVHSAIGLGMRLDSGFQESVAFALGQTKTLENGKVVADLDAMSGLMAGAGAALSVVAAIENPTAANVAGAAMHVYGFVSQGLPIPAVNAIASAIGFVENPSFEGGLTTAAWTAACIPGPQQPFFIAAAAVISVVTSVFGGGKPIVLDMDGDGVKLAPVDSSLAFYDLDGDGWREHVGWAGPGDALFAYDANGDGVISGKDELSYVGYREGARTDLEGLLAFDSNHDGKLDAKDAEWSKFKVWRDDGDGLSEAGELLTPEQAGVASLTLASDQVQVAAGGNTVYGTGTFTRTDGSVSHFTDTAFGADGKGNVPLAADGTAVVLNLLGASVHTTGLQATSVSFDRDGDGTAEQGGWIAPDEGFLVADLNNDGQLEMISSFAQLAPLDSNGDGRITSADAAWTQLGIWVDKNMDGGVQRNELYTLAQLGLSGIDVGATSSNRYDNGNFIRAEGGFTFADGSHGHAAQVELSGGSEPDGNLLYVSDGVTTLRQQDGRITQFVQGGTRLDVGGDIAVATGGGNTLVGGRDAVIMVSAGGDTLLGSAGNDLLITRGGDNVLAGGGGADRLQGGDGDDTYVFNKGDGADTITDGGGVDTLSFGAGITAADIVVEAVGGDLVVGVRSRAADQGKPATALADRVVIKGGATSVENIRFADGTNWSLGMKVVQTANGPRLVYDDAARNDVAFWREALNAGGPGALAAEMAAALAALAAGAAILRPDLADAQEVLHRADVPDTTRTALGTVTDTAAGGALSPLVLADLTLPTGPAVASAEKRVTAADVTADAPVAAPTQSAAEVVTVQAVVAAEPTPGPTPAQPLPVTVVGSGAVVSQVPPTPVGAVQPAQETAIDAEPVARADQLVTDEDTPLLMAPSALLGNDADPEGRPLQLVSVGGVIGGTVTLDASGNVLFIPAANFNGTASFQYTIQDDGGHTATATAIIAVAAVNDAPLVVGETIAGTEDTVLSIAPGLLLANDSDIEGDTLSISAVGNAVGGTVALDGAGNVVFTPNANFNGTASFQYTVSDGQGGETVATAQVNVAAVNDAPLVAGETIAGTEDTVLSIAPGLLLANDNDIEGDTLSISAVGNPTGGTVALDGSGNVVFTPTANFNGAASFQYTVSDGQGGLTVATAQVNVAAVNDAPLVAGETIAGTEDTVLTIAPDLLLANDSDIEGDALSVSAVGNATGGTVTLDGAGNVVFTPTANFNGPASFDYTVSDGQGGLTVATAQVNVAAVNDAPLVTGEMLAGVEDTVLNVTCASLLANDSDIEGDTLSISAVGNATGGTVALDALGNVVFTPTANYHGVAGFDYTVSDGHGGQTVSSVVLGIAAVNDAPVAVADALTMNEDTTLSIAVSTLLANDTDVDGDTLTLTGVSGASNGSVTLSGGTITYTPDPNFYGSASFQYTLSDGQVTVTGTANVTVNDVPEPPPPSGGGGGGGGGKPVVLDLDGDGIELTSIDEKSVLFDINDDGFLDKLGWVAGDDGLLAYDHDGNGLIEHGNEISFAQYLDGARTDLEGLRAFDSNGDGVLDAADDQWSKFGIWRDADGDGITDAGEFRDLATAGIKNVGLDSDWNSYGDHGNTVFGHTSYATVDGRTAVAADVMLAMEDGKTIQVALPAAEPSAADLAGQIASLKSLMAAYTGAAPATPEPVPDDGGLAVIALPEEEAQFRHV